MTQELRKSLRSLWQDRPIKSSPYVFLCLDVDPDTHEHYGKPFQYRQYFMRQLCKSAGITPFGFHAIRHLTASYLYNIGTELAIIQTILRHKSPTTRERYLRSIGLERVREAFESLTPKAEAAEVIELDNAREQVRMG